MAVLVFNKRTGKYLRNHSGSYNHFIGMIFYRAGVRESMIKQLGEYLDKHDYTQDYVAARDEWRRKARMFKADIACDASPEEARVYHNAGSTLISVGKSNGLGQKMTLPEYFEIHEIKQTVVCIMRPNGSSNCDEDD